MGLVHLLERLDKDRRLVFQEHSVNIKCKTIVNIQSQTTR
jgi:hypothetical protein